MTEPTELLPCPFCGHSGPLDFQDGSTHRWGVAYCAECGASAGETRREYPDVGEWHAKAIAQWNTRTPQPTQAQAGAVPLTDEQLPLLRFATSSLFHLFERWNNKEIPHYQLMDEMGQVVEHVIRRTVAAHGIKGGQHGAEY